MNLPIFNELLENQSNYINFSKSLNDLDYAQYNDTPYYLSRFVALNLPNFVQDQFFIDLNPVMSSNNPNVLMPKALQYYTENIIRQPIECPEITELAFWKTLKKFGMSTEQIKESVVFSNRIVHSAFHQYKNNNGWSEVVCKIPNRCDKLTTAWKTIESLPDVNNYPSEYLNDDALYDDNGTKTFDFSIFNEKLDFDNFVFEENGDIDDSTEFKFNAILIFYFDKDGVEKLHGINFINPFVNKHTHFELPRYTQRTNDYRSIGYQFKFIMKTVNNEASRVLIEIYNFETESFWAAFEETLSGLNNQIYRFPNQNKSI